ncbi:hypothetical protein MICABA_00155 [Microbacterium sp. T2.11-28]|nr:hypothetical protein MICABA_00155 [Microbacterium sp. T2.11-28]
MADQMTLLHDLRRRVENLERRGVPGSEGVFQGRPLRDSRPRRMPQRPDRDSISILHYLQSNQTQPVENRDNEAILNWLFTPNKRTDPGATGSVRATSKGH